MNKSCKPFFGHLEPFSQDREKGEAPGKTVTGFAGRKKVYRICSRSDERLGDKIMIALCNWKWYNFLIFGDGVRH
jgi:hypothetical protein